MIIIYYQNKTLYNKVFFGTYFTEMLMFSHIERTRLKFNNANKIRQFNMIFNTM